MMNILEYRTKEISDESFKENISNIFKTASMFLNSSGWRLFSIDSNDKDKVKISNNEELKKSLYKVYKIKFKNTENEDVVYTLNVPIVFDKYYLFLSGQYKIPIIQLVDLPILFKGNYDNFLLKFKSNIFSARIVRKRKGYFLRIFNKFVPLNLIISYFYSDTISSYLEKNSGKSKLFDSIADDILSKGIITDEEKCVYEIGEIFSENTYITKKEEKIKKGNSVLYSIDVGYELDYFTKRFIKNDFFIIDMLDAILGGEIDDASLSNKRLRLMEYILVPLIKKCHEFLVFIEKHRGEKFKISPSIILESCISTVSEETPVGDIVRYLNVLNPVGVVSNLFHCTLVGPGGFKKKNVPFTLRDLHDSHYGYLCPSDTPDRDGCGVLYNIVPTAKIDNLGRFVEPGEDIVTSFPISLVPFSQYDDPTRLQMSSSQIKQTIPIINSELPMIQSGCEGDYVSESGFIRYAEDDGYVLYLDRNFMIVIYDNLTGYRKIGVYKIGYVLLYLGCLDYLYPKFKVNERFKKGDVLCSSSMIKNGKIALGRNLFTVIMPFHGYNYEDGIVISEEVVDKFVSMHSVDLSFLVEPSNILLSLTSDGYEPLFPIGSSVNRGEVYARMKNLNIDDDVSVIYEDSFELKSPVNCKIVDLKIYPNEYNKKIIDYYNFIEKMSLEQMRKYNLVISGLEQFVSYKDIENILHYHGLTSYNINKKEGNFYYKKRKINGIMFYYIGEYKDKIEVGDKISNRHGNKGVVSKILPKERMPMLPDGRRAEIILNPLGIISRMNVGQIMEMHLSECLFQLKKELKKLGNVRKSNKLLISFLNKLYSSKYRNNRNLMDKILDEFELNVEKYSFEEAVDRLYLISSPFRSPTYEEIKAASEFLPEFKEKDYVEYIDEKGKRIITEKPISYGYMYFNKLVHRVKDKFTARSVGPYNVKTLQPVGGRKNKGGHRFGEMEVWSLLAHNSKVFLKELMTSYSDSVYGKSKLLTSFLSSYSMDDLGLNEYEFKPKSLKLLESYLNILNLSMLESDKREQEMIKSSRKYLQKEEMSSSREEVFGTYMGDIMKEHNIIE